MDRVFLDANVLFSAAYRLDSRLTDLWSLTDTQLFTSLFAIEEARRNSAVHRPDAVSRLEGLLRGLMIVEGLDSSLPEGVELDDKDAPILSAALRAGCTHLVTGDHQHFGAFFGRSIRGVLILTPAQYLKSCVDRS